MNARSTATAMASPIPAYDRAGVIASRKTRAADALDAIGETTRAARVRGVVGESYLRDVKWYLNGVVLHEPDRAPLARVALDALGALWCAL